MARSTRVGCWESSCKKTLASARQDRRNVYMQQIPASGIDGRLNRPASRRAFHKAKQVTELCIQMWSCRIVNAAQIFKLITSSTKQGICSSMRSGCVWLLAHGGLLRPNVNHKHVVVSEL